LLFRRQTDTLCGGKCFLEEVSRRHDILTVYFGTDKGSAYKIDTIVDTLNAIRELYDCFSLLCYGKKTDKNRSTVCFKTGSLEIIYGFFIGIVTTGVCVPILSPTFTEFGNRLRDRFFGKNSSEEDNISLSKMIQKWFENTSESNTKLLTEKRGKQTERFVSNIFEMKCGEKVIHPEPRPSDFPLLRQETEEENSKTDLERCQLKLFR